MESTVFDIIQESIEFHESQTARAKEAHRTNPLNVKVPINWEKEFEATNAKGCEYFGWDWIRANESAISAASNFGVNYEHPQIRTFMQSIVFAVLDRVSNNLTKQQ